MTYLQIAEILNNVQHPSHLTENKDFVVSLQQSIQHLIQNFDLATDVNQFIVNPVVEAVSGEWVFQQVWVVSALSEIHHAIFHAEVRV